MLSKFCVIWDESLLSNRSEKSPLHTIHHCSRTMTKLLFCEKNWVLWNVTKRDLHTIRHKSQFLRRCVATENTMKKVLSFCQKTANFGKCISRRTFSQNAHKSWQITLYTQFVFRSSFVGLSIFRGCSWIVCSELKKLIKIDYRVPKCPCPSLASLH